MNDLNRQYKELEEKFGVSDNKQLINQIKIFINNNELDEQTKSKALSLIGSIICYLSPNLKDDCGYSYFKAALEKNDDNYDAILGICSIFNTYPYPFSEIVSEVEYIECIEKLIKDFDYLEEKNKCNVMETIKGYLLYRKKFINKYGYSSKSVKDSN